jgi:hypothetical protein
MTYAGLVDKLATIDIAENERNVNNKISQIGFTTAFLPKCLKVLEAEELRL